MIRVPLKGTMTMAGPYEVRYILTIMVFHGKLLLC